VWNRQLDIYGRVKREIKASSLGDDVRPFIPFLYQGQYYDFETNLAYNRFRYYSPETGAYISQDPIGLAGGNPTIYGYVKDSNWWVDRFGLRDLTPEEIEKLDKKLNEVGNPKKGVYNFPDNKKRDEGNYSGSAGTRGGTNTIRDRLMQHMRNDKLDVKDIEKNLTIYPMDDKADQDVWDKEAATIKADRENGTGSTNQRRPPNTSNEACGNKKK